MSENTMLEITSDPESARTIVLELIKGLRGPNGRGASREVSLAITKLQEAGYWLGEAMFGSMPANTGLQADGCKSHAANAYLGYKFCPECGQPFQAPAAKA